MAASYIATVVNMMFGLTYLQEKEQLFPGIHR